VHGLEALEHLGLKLAPEYRRDREGPPRFLREPLEAAVDRLAYTGRHDRPHVGTIEPALRGQEPDGLHDEQRVSFGAAVNSLEHRLRRPPADAEFDIVADLRAPKPAKREPRHRRLPDQLGDQPIERMPRSRLGIAVCG
jgi:hypothetical protein